MLLSVKKTDRLFFDTFAAMAGGAVAAALILEEMFRDGKGGDGAVYASRIKEIEHRCDVQIHELVKTLHRTFITPIDREDIHDLASRMDDLIDLIDAVASRAVLYRVSGEIPDAADMARIIDSGRDPIFVIKAKEIIETLEAATDAGEDIAIVLERIILKHQ